MPSLIASKADARRIRANSPGLGIVLAFSTIHRQACHSQFLGMRAAFVECKGNVIVIVWAIFQLVRGPPLTPSIPQDQCSSTHVPDVELAWRVHRF